MFILKFTPSYEGKRGWLDWITNNLHVFEIRYSKKAITPSKFSIISVLIILIDFIPSSVIK